MNKLLIALVLVATAATASAQPQDAAPGGRAIRPRAEGLTPADASEMLDAYALLQAERTLNLRESQFGDFVTRLKLLQQTRRRNQQQRVQMLRELQRLTNPQRGEGDENTVRERLKALREHDDRAAAELRKAYDAVDEILDPRQQARFRLFEENLERRKLDLLMRARQGAARGR